MVSQGKKNNPTKFVLKLLLSLLRFILHELAVMEYEHSKKGSEISKVSEFLKIISFNSVCQV